VKSRTKSLATGFRPSGWAKHLAFYAGAYPIEVHKDELSACDISKGTIRFQAARPLPAALVRKLVRTRIAQYADGARRQQLSSS
jgi:uncharacterized protein YdhG (YjbR/CyaY superfamily)